MWSALIFNLIASLLIGGWFLWSARGILRRMDDRYRKMNERMDAEEAKIEAARQEILASMRIKTDRVIAEMQGQSLLQPADDSTALRHLDTARPSPSEVLPVETETTGPDILPQFMGRHEVEETRTRVMEAVHKLDQCLVEQLVATRWALRWRFAALVVLLLVFLYSAGYAAVSQTIETGALAIITVAPVIYLLHQIRALGREHVAIALMTGKYLPPLEAAGDMAEIEAVAAEVVRDLRSLVVIERFQAAGQTPSFDPDLWTAQLSKVWAVIRQMKATGIDLRVTPVNPAPPAEAP